MTSTVEYLGSRAEDLLSYKARVSSELLHLPGSDFIDRTWKNSDRNPQVLRNLAQSIIMVAYLVLGMFQFFLLIKELNTRLELLLHQIQRTSIHQT